MSMLTPAGMGGKYRVTGRGYLPPPKRRGRRVALVGAITLVTVVGTGAVWHFALGQGLPGLSAAKQKARACAAGARSSGHPAAGGAVAGAVPASRPSAASVSPGQVTVNVYNATDRAGLASHVAGELRARGFAVGQVANDPTHAKITGPAQVRAAAGSAGQLRLVLAQVAGAATTADGRRDASVDLVLGDGFQELRAPAEASAALTPPAPSKPAAKGRC